MCTHETLLSVAKSWSVTESSVNTTAELLAWIAERNRTVAVDIHKTDMKGQDFWFYDEGEGCIRNQNRSFFTIVGFRRTASDGTLFEQPMIRQAEIGYLGILCKEIDGVMYFLMQAKIEPGNVNKIQISPTIQATKSNFTKKHGGAEPPYLEYFLHSDRYEVIADQIQSEQSSRFWKKRNRNIILRAEEDVPVLPSHRWMTLGQLKTLMRTDNLVNMDTRTVLSCIPYSSLELTEKELITLSECFTDKSLFCSVFAGEKNYALSEIYSSVNNYKMFAEGQVSFPPLGELRDWTWEKGEFICKKPWPFKITFCDISMEGREVKHWTQPLFEATGIATFGLICCEDDGLMKFAVKLMPEPGCFDGVELGPTVQREAVSGISTERNDMDRLFDRCLASGNGVFYDHLLSEEGGRFLNEQNRNVLVRIRKEDLPALPKGYFLLDYRTLNRLTQVNNILNIQLRNLLSLLEA